MWKKIKQLLPTAVTRNGEKSAKFTFIFRKKYYLSRKISVKESATTQSCENIMLLFSAIENLKKSPN